MGAVLTAEGNEARAGRSPLASPTLATSLIVAVAVATRIVAWWNPVAHVDDQFYLLAGEELLAGRWPYVDVWDRKPLGLFLLYAAIAWIGGGTILGLNLVATAFAAATALVIRQIALRFASASGATLGALAYLFVIPLVGGQTGQSPVFYNLLMAGAAWLLVDAADRPGPVARRALTAMLLCGLAMTIKQISFVEGSFFGLAFLWLLRRRGTGLASLSAVALAMIAVALLPTTLAVAGYAAAGRAELEAHLFATVTSIFLKGDWGATSRIAGVQFFVLQLTLLVAMAIAGAVMRHRRGPTSKDRILVGWMAAAMLGYVAIPHFFEHYALPLVVPLSVSAATFFDRRLGPLYFAALAAFCLITRPPDIRDARAARHGFDRLSAAVDRARHGGCIHVADGPTHLYSSTGACQVTKYLFPDHLSLSVEAGAIGVDPGAELQRILARKPAVIVTRDRKLPRYSPAYRAFVDRLPADYRPVHAATLKPPLKRQQRFLVWQRKDLAPPKR